MYRKQRTFCPQNRIDIERPDLSRSWILPAHDASLDVFYGKKHEVDLVAAAFVHELAETLYFLDDKISEPVRQEVIDSMYTRAFNPVKDALQTGQGYTFNWFNNTNNWNAVWQKSPVPLSES